jgi:hypothetical protein
MEWPGGARVAGRLAGRSTAGERGAGEGVVADADEDGDPSSRSRHGRRMKTRPHRLRPTSLPGAPSRSRHGRHGRRRGPLPSEVEEALVLADAGPRRRNRIRRPFSPSKQGSSAHGIRHWQGGRPRPPHPPVFDPVGGGWVSAMAPSARGRRRTRLRHAHEGGGGRGSAMRTRPGRRREQGRGRCAMVQGRKGGWGR